MFTLEQLVSFGKYLLSDERIARVQEERAGYKDEKLDKVHIKDIFSWGREWEQFTAQDISHLMNAVEQYQMIRDEEIGLIQS